MVRININFGSKTFYTLIAILSITILSVFVYAYKTGASPSIMGHSAEELEVTIGGNTYTLQQAITNNLIGAASTSKRIFVTSAKFQGNLKSFTTASDGLTAADRLCMDYARFGGLVGNWKALITTMNENARDRMNYDWDRIVNLHGETVAVKGGCGSGTATTVPSFVNAWSPWGTEMIGGTPTNLCGAVKYDEKGVVIPSGEYAWTGTQYDGVRGPGYVAANQCNDWTWAGTSAYIVLQGDPNSNTRNWIDGNAGGCEDSAHLYCLEA